MPSSRAWIRATRRLLVAAVAFSCAAAALAQSPPTGRNRGSRSKAAPTPASRPTPPPATQPAPDPVPAETRPAGPETVADAFRRLTPVLPKPLRTPARRAPRGAAPLPTAPPPPPALTHNERALRAVLDLTLALGQADGKRAALVIDGSGYQPLPETGELPERPDKPLHAAAVAALVAARAPAPLGELLVEDFRVARAREIESRYPPIARWMLSREDRAVLIRAPETPVPGWIARDAVVVVRLRGAVATVVGGTLLDCLTPAPPGAGRPTEPSTGGSPPAATPTAPPVAAPTAPPAAAPATRPAAKPAAAPKEGELPPVAAPQTPAPPPRPATRPALPPRQPLPPPAPEEPEGEDK